MKPCTFRPQPSKSFPKKTRSKKIFYIFSKESFSYIFGNGTLHFSVKAREIKKIHPEKISYTSGNRNPEKTSYIFLQRKLFLCFGKRSPEKFFTFQETELSKLEK